MKPCQHCGLGDLALSDIACRWQYDGTPQCEVDKTLAEKCEDRNALIVFGFGVALVVICIVVVAAHLSARI